MAGATIAALGVVFGDIGTSPLYAFRETLASESGLTVAPDTVLGVASLIVWSLIVVISVKYLTVVMRADAKGEGGILALASLMTGRSGRTGRVLFGLGLFGTALLYGDGAITPAISVLSAVEGLAVVTDRLEPAVIPLTLAILVGLFSVQSRGTGQIGAVFGRIMLVWFSVLALLGLAAIIGEPAILRALNPLHGVRLFIDNGFGAFRSLGAIFLVVTGGEALYADMGHFGRPSITHAWFRLAFPALILNYLGQGALLLDRPDAISNPFFLLAPGWALIPLVILATAATVIASQALISGVFSLSVQAVQMNLLPRMAVRHTSEETRGQVYVPAVNVGLLVACIALVLSFRSSSALAGAYGVAVTATMLITTVLFYRAAQDHLGWPSRAALAVCLPFAVVDLGFLGANLLKIPDGGWLPLLGGVALMVLMTTWRTGRTLVLRARGAGQLAMDAFLDDLDLDDVRRLPGTAVYMFSKVDVVPPAMLATLRHFASLHERLVVLTVRQADRAHIPGARRIQRSRTGEVEQITLTFGFRDPIDVPAALRSTVGTTKGLDEKTVQYFLGREHVVATDRPGMALWRERLFSRLLRNSTDAASFFNLPPERTTTLSQTIEI